MHKRFHFKGRHRHAIALWEADQLALNKILWRHQFEFETLGLQTDYEL